MLNYASAAASIFWRRFSRGYRRSERFVCSPRARRHVLRYAALPLLLYTAIEVVAAAASELFIILRHYVITIRITLIEPVSNALAESDTMLTLVSIAAIYHAFAKGCAFACFH